MATPDSGGQLNIPTEIPTSSENALNFLHDIAEEDYTFLLFSDDLVTTSDTGSEVGEFTVTVEPTKHNDQDCFLIHASSHGRVDGVPCGTSIVSYVSKSLQTLEQELHEYVKLEDLPLDRKTYILRQEDGYLVNKVIVQGKEEQKLTRHFNLDIMEGFMSEGSNLLLHRLLVTKGFAPDDFTLVSFDSETNLSSANYRPLPERTQIVGDQEVQVTGVERTIQSSTDLPTTWQSYFLADGRLSNRVQVGSPVTMKLLRVPAPIDKGGEPPKPVFEKEPLDWENDIQMYSKFLDRKEDLKADHSLYMRRHPELRAIVADFLQFLLLRKPENVTDFARNYFSTFSKHTADKSPYLNSDSNVEES